MSPLAPGLRPSAGTRSVARVGNPSFGPPPTDIAASLSSGGSSLVSVSNTPTPAGSAGGGTGVAGERAAIIKFNAGSAGLSEGDRNRIRIVADLYRKRGGAIRVEGHASSRTHDMDPVKHQMVNFNISLRRANAVATELARNGVPQESIFVAAMSDSQPIFYEVMPAGDAGNQRAEIYFVN